MKEAAEVTEKRLHFSLRLPISCLSMSVLTVPSFRLVPPPEVAMR